MLVDLEDRLARLQNEMRRGSGQAKISSSVFRPRGNLGARMKGIRELQAASVKENVALLEEVLIELAQKRDDRHSAVKLAMLMSEKKGDKVSSRLLYRMPYLTMWRPELDFLGSNPIDKDPRVRRYARRTKSLLISVILRTRKTFRVLSAGRGARLLEGTEDWGLL